MKKWQVITVFVLAFVLRVINLFPSPLWYDENFSYMLSRLPLDRLIQATAGDVHPPLYYMLLWPLGQIPGVPGQVMRLPSVLFSMLAIWVFYRMFVVRAPIPKWRVIAFLLFAFMPEQIYYAWEARMYSLLTLLILLAYWALRSRQWGWYWILACALLWTHNYGLFYVACLWLAGILMDRTNWRKITEMTVAAGMIWLPWGLVLLRQMGGIAGSYWMIDFNLGYVLYTLGQIFFVKPGSALSNDLLNMFVFYGWLAYALIFGRRLPAWVYVMTFGTWALAVVGSLLWQPILLFRALVPCGPFLVLILSRPFERIQTRRGWLLAGILIGPALLSNLAILTFGPVMYRASAAKIDEMHTYIKANWQPGDIAFHVGDGSLINMLATANEPDAYYHLRSCGMVYGGLSDETRLAITGRDDVLLDELDFTRAWVITSETPLTPTCEADYLAQRLAGLDPLLCMRDDRLVRECLWLISK
jgi:uncharacterized membrane protein